VGDKKGRVGVGLGKASNVRSAIIKGIKRAKKHLIKVPLVGTTIPHKVLVKRGAAQVLLKPALSGTGLVAGGAVRVVVEAAGIRDIVSKILGTSNQASNVYATLEALARLRSIPRDSKEKSKKREGKIKREESFEKLKLTTRLDKLLKKAGIKTISDLKSLSDQDILAIKGLGPKGLREIREVLGVSR
jgi:small subunit ribosomal protein S5